MLDNAKLNHYIETAKRLQRGHLKEIKFNGIEDFLTTKQIAMLDSLKTDESAMGKKASGFVTDLQDLLNNTPLQDTTYRTKAYYGVNKQGKRFYIEIYDDGVDFYSFDKDSSNEHATATQMISICTNCQWTYSSTLNKTLTPTPDNIYYEKNDGRGHKACYYFLKDDKEKGHYRIATIAQKNFGKSKNISK